MYKGYVLLSLKPLGVPSLMNIENLRAFLEIASTGSFQLAAEKLHLTQSTISARIKVLEDRLNRPLFVRKRDGAQLTQAGQHLHRHAVTVVRAWERARQEVSLPDELTYMFSLGIQLNHWDQVAPAWLAWMEHNVPKVATRIISDYSEPLMRMLRDGLLDVAILYIPKQHANLRIEKFIEEDIILVASEPRVVDYGKVDGYIFVDWGDEFRAQHSEAFPDSYIPRLSVGLSSLGLSHILTHGGSGYFTTSSVQQHLDEGRLFRVQDAPVFTRTIYLGYPTMPLDIDLQTKALNGLRHIGEKFKKGPQ